MVRIQLYSGRGTLAQLIGIGYFDSVPHEGTYLHLQAGFRQVEVYEVDQIHTTMFRPEEDKGVYGAQEIKVHLRHRGTESLADNE